MALRCPPQLQNERYVFTYLCCISLSILSYHYHTILLSYTHHLLPVAHIIRVRRKTDNQTGHGTTGDEAVRDAQIALPADHYSEVL